MDPFQNPYAPGAGVKPPELAGRDALLKKAHIAIKRIAAGQFSRSIILTGLRGVGKTVLLNRIRQEAELAGIIAVRVESVEGRSLPSLIAPAIKSALLKLNRSNTSTRVVKKGLCALVNFVSSMRSKYGEIELGIDIKHDAEPLMGFDLDEGLSQFFLTIGELAKQKKTAIVFFIDELQTIDEKELSALIQAFHMAAQDLIPITMVAAGLPQIPAKMGKSKTYAERLFEFADIDRLDSVSATRALSVPAKKLGVTYSKSALDAILKQTEGYAYFLQEWGKHAWEVAKKSPISEKDVKQATILALADLDASFFRVRFDQLTPMQKRYLRTMAELGAGPHGSGKIARLFGKKVSDLGPVRDQLINKGLIYSPSHGETAFTVPLFDVFMKRMMVLEE